MKKDNIFWVSYSDLMTSMFFVMMVLFVIAIGHLKSVADATKKQLDKIQELQHAVQQLPEKYFEYQPQYKRFKLNSQIQFARGSAEINPIYRTYLMNVGYSVVKLISDLNKNEEYKKFDIKYLIVVEGMASRDNYPLNYELSYKRALALYKLWKDNGITFDPHNCEIQISGSGIEGIREYNGNQEYRNQQFLIHIIPKMGKIIEN
jgi:outer membrane protein OmpA-like peptidoglycan-associated protein